MVLKRQLQLPGTEEPVEIEKARESFIRGGGMVASDVKKNNQEWKIINLRIKAEAIAQIDELNSKTMGVTRTGWILQAIEEKLKLD